MRTKITILSAVALAAGLLSSNAQVYSANVVGYYNIVTPLGSPGAANVKKNLISNQLLGAGGSNQVNVVLQQGLGDSTSQGVDLALWNGAQYVNYTYYGPTDSSGAPGFYDGISGLLITNKLKQGEGAFLINYSGKAITNTIVGEVVQGPITNTVAVGKAPYAICVPVSTNIIATFVNIVYGDGLSQKADYNHWNVTSQHFDQVLNYYGPTDAATTLGAWYGAGDGLDHSFDPAYAPAVGAGFEIVIYGGHAAYQWVSSFSVQ